MFEGIELDIIERDEAGMLVRTGTKVFAPAEQPLSKWVSGSLDVLAELGVPILLPRREKNPLPFLPSVSQCVG